MGFYLQVEVDSTLPPEEFRQRVLIPLDEALKKEGVGQLLDPVEDDNPPEGTYELAIQVTDQDRAAELIQDVLSSADLHPR